MSDLISRSELLEELKSLKIVLNGKQIFSDDAKDTVLRIVNEQPIAYDINKVVEELEKSTQYIKINGKPTSVKAIHPAQAIEIVKRGCVFDDVCEWKLDGVYLNSPHKPLVSCVTDENYRYYYCPVCGKKIKAVE